MKRLTLDRRVFYSVNAIIVYWFVAKILFHLLHPEYGYFRDELYYLAIGDHFNPFNLDVLPLTPLLMKLMTTLFGLSLKSLHFGSALCGAVALLLVCLMARDLGGGRYAVLLTGLFVFFSGFLIFGALFTYDSIDFMLQTAALYVLLKIVQQDRQQLWLLFGLLIGLGLLNKLSILIFSLAVFVALWLVPQRVSFRQKWIWLGALIAAVFAIPFILWQISQDWYFLGIAASYSGGTAYIASFPEFVWGQILPNNIFSLPVWLTGLGVLFFKSGWKKYRLFGWMYLFVFLLAFFLGVKFYFTIPMYTILLAVGAVQIEQFFLKKDFRRLAMRTARAAFLLLYIILSLPLLPMIVPILPIEQFVDYAALFGVHAGVRHEVDAPGQLPQHVADRYGWPQMVVQIAALHDSVQAELGKPVGILTGNYGQAAAVQILGKKYELPQPLSVHGWYYFEALRRDRFENRCIAMGMPRRELQDVFTDVRQIAVFTHPYCMPYENKNPIYLCQSPKYNLPSYWRVMRNMDGKFRRIIDEQGVWAAANHYYRFKELHPDQVLFTERQMNALGYEYLYDGQIEEAIELFRLNVLAYPDAFNTYDSLAEGYMENGQLQLAVEYYQKSLQLNPDNQNAVEKLAELAGRMGKDRQKD